MTLPVPRSSFRLTPALLVLGLCACDPPQSKEGVAYSIEAAKDAEYNLDCRFPAYKIQGSLINTYRFDKKGPDSGLLPTYQPRCTLKKLGGPGPVTLKLTKNGAVTSGTVQDIGEEKKVFVY